MAGKNGNHRQLSPTTSTHRRRDLFEIAMVIIFVALAIELVMPVYAQYSKLIGDSPPDSKATQLNSGESIDLLKGKGCPHKKCTLTPTVTTTWTPSPNTATELPPTPEFTPTDTLTPTPTGTVTMTATPTNTPRP